MSSVPQAYGQQLLRFQAKILRVAFLFSVVLLVLGLATIEIPEMMRLQDDVSNDIALIGNFWKAVSPAHSEAHASFHGAALPSTECSPVFRSRHFLALSVLLPVRPVTGGRDLLHLLTMLRS